MKFLERDKVFMAVNLTSAYVKIFYDDKIEVSERIGAN